MSPVDTGPPEMRSPGGKPGQRKSVDFRADNRQLHQRLPNVQRHLAAGLRRSLGGGIGRVDM